MRIEDYALVGDTETAALVGCDGSIDWLCWPRFDSGACFAALLGNKHNGRWLMAPCGETRPATRRYREGTLVLETEFETPGGSVTLTDFMPPRGNASDLVRLLTCTRGEVRMHTELVIRFDYGSLVPWVSRLPDGSLRAIAGPDMLVLRTPVELHGEDLRTVGEFTIKAGEEIPFVLTCGPSHAPPPKAIDWRRALAQTERFWKQWSGRYRGTGRYADPVRHSLIVLKALTYRPTGGIVAAPTTSLPEKLGGPRNWDYRYCWLRDATFTLLALMDSGYFDEASRWRDWLLRAVAGTPTQVQIMYGIAGERRLTEWDIGWLGGYEGSHPVRVGNAAADQLKLDIYGEVMDVLHVARCGAVGGKEPAWGLQKSLLEHLESIWQKPDSGIWEMRGAPRHFTHSKVMAWVAFDRAVRTAEQFSLEGPTERWRETRDRLKSEICERGFNRDIGAFTQSYGSTELDASLLLLPLVGFLEPSDPRVKSTVAAIERDLMHDGFVRRYRTEKTDDGLSGGEGLFLACSFWLADNFVLLGRREEARRLFERLLSLANDVGLLSEEYDPKSGRLLGNFPQALSHIALINTAQNLMREGTPAEQRSGSKAA